MTAADRDRSQTHVQDLSVNNLGHNVSVPYFLTSASSAWNCAVHHIQVRNVLVNAIYMLLLCSCSQEQTLLISFSAFRWLISTLAVRFLRSVLNADLKIKSVGLFSIHGVSIQFHPHHILVSQTVYTWFKSSFSCCPWQRNNI